MATSKFKFNTYMNSMRTTHWPIIYVKFKEYHGFLLNTSLPFNYIRYELWEKIRGHCMVLPDREFAGENHRVCLITFEYGGIQYTEEFLVLPQGDRFYVETSGGVFKYDVMIGTIFLHKHKWIIDYGKRRVYAMKEVKKKKANKK